jgi:dipeptidyl aminopeptidase/acylaminoacyl peptidase
VTVVGHSAGGHLALWLAAHRGLAGVVSLAGVADLVAAEDQHLGDGAVREFLRGGSAVEHAEVDPARLVPTGVPSLLVHGDDDANVPLDQSERYRDAAVAAGDDCRLLRLDGADHFVVIDPASEAWSQAWAQWPGRDVSRT